MSGHWGPDADRAYFELNRSWERFTIRLVLWSAVVFTWLGFVAGWMFT